MKIVSTPTAKNREINLDYLATRKVELKEQIENQKQQITVSTQNLLSPATFLTYVVRGFSKGLNVMDGVMIGFKIIRTIRGIFKK